MVEPSQKARDAATTFFRDALTPLSVKMVLGYDPAPLLNTLAAFEAEIRVEYETADAESVERLREALEPFARIAVVGDVIAGLDPDQFRHHVAKARRALSGGSGGRSNG